MVKNRMRIIRKTVGALLCFSLLFSATAQSDDDWLFTTTDDDLFTSSSADDDLLFGSSDDDLFTSSDDDMFGGDDMFGEEITADESSSGLSVFSGLDLINTEKVRFGGSASFGISSNTSFNNLFSSNVESASYWKDSFYNTILSPSIGAELYFDAHPDEILRLYGKVGVDYPFSVTSGFVSVPNFYVKELFTDFSLGDNLYFRFGKHAVKWGVGYFFSPADVINLGAIDPENPTAVREGPVSLRTQITIPGTQNCLYLYGILGDKNLVRDAAFAAKYEFLVGNYEIGTGFWYKYMRSPRLMVTTTGSLKDISLFAEGVAAWGREEEWADDTAFTDMKPVFQATLGGSYTWNEPKISLSMQYFYNGFGVADIKDSNLQDLISKRMLYSYCGQHYVATSISKSSLFDNDDIGLSLFGIMSLTDLSGMGSLNCSISLFRNCSMSFGPSFTFGPEKSEYIYLSAMNDQNTLRTIMMSDGENWRGNMSFKISFSLGGGKF
ncbi:MAG: hypothetical protein K5930_01480 [Treponemataceae bacterium]|nr:hypothetical protein [Treponemataceae bacterium]